MKQPKKSKSKSKSTKKPIDVEIFEALKHFGVVESIKMLLEPTYKENLQQTPEFRLLSAAYMLHLATTPYMDEDSAIKTFIGAVNYRGMINPRTDEEINKILPL